MGGSTVVVTKQLSVPRCTKTFATFLFHIPLKHLLLSVPHSTKTFATFLFHIPLKHLLPFCSTLH